jgi:Predicted glycosyltransferases|nr:glycosyltransferase family 2 protein [uncultured Steroidobacter sp.]
MTIATLVRETDAIGGEVIIANHGGDTAQLSALLGAHTSAVQIATIPSDSYFSKTCAMNVGGFLSRHDVLFFCDCDIIPEPGTVAHLAAAVRNRSDAFATIKRVRESDPPGDKAGHITRFDYCMRLTTRTGRQVCIDNHAQDLPAGYRNAPGLLCVRRAHFIEIRGYNSRLAGWGWEDQDMICRLTLGLGLQRVDEGEVIHVSHSDAERTFAYEDTDRWISRDRAFRRSLARYDEGDFLGTLDSDVSDSLDILSSSPPRS